MSSPADFGGNEAVQFGQDAREYLIDFCADSRNFSGNREPRKIELPATDYPQLVARAPIAIVAVSGTSYALLPKSYEGDLRRYLSNGAAPLTTACAFPSAMDCVFQHSLLTVAASPWGAVMARVAPILSVSPDLGSPLAIARDVIQQRDLIEIQLADVRIALAQHTRSHELTASGLMRTALQLEREGANPSPSNWHAIRATLAAGAAAVQLVPRLSWLNLGGEYVIWSAAIATLLGEDAVTTRVVDKAELRDFGQLLHLRDSASRLVIPRLLVGPAESRDRRRHRAMDDGHVWAANHTDAKRESAGQGNAVVKSSNREVQIEIDRESSPAGPRRLRVRVFVTLATLWHYTGIAAIIFVVLVGLHLLINVVI